jgi:hypothetical protein
MKNCIVIKTHPWSKPVHPRQQKKFMSEIRIFMPSSLNGMFGNCNNSQTRMQEMPVPGIELGEWFKIYSSKHQPLIFIFSYFF